MFDLGIKQIIINSDSVVTEELRTAGGGTPTTGDSGNTVKVEGFGSFIVPLVADADATNFVTAAVAPALGVYTATMAAGKVVVGDVIDVRVYTNGPRVIGELWPYNTNSFIFQAVITVNDEIGSALIAGQNGNGIANTVLEFAAGANELAPKINVLAGYEGVAVEKVTYTMAGDSYANVADAMEQPLTVATTTAANEGLNTGRMLEAEVRNAIFENIDPYGVSFGGNSAVDVRGMYTEIHWSTAADTNGWEPHAMLGFGDANTTTNYAPRQYSAFCNEVSATGAITLLTALSAGGAITA